MVVGSQTSRRFEADPVVLADVRRFVRGCAEEAGLSERTIDDLLLAATEASANAVLHSGSGRFDVVWTRREDRIEIEVRDHGAFRRRVRVPELEGPGGFGIPLMMSLTDEFELHEGTRDRPGTSVRLVKLLRGS